MSRLHHACLTLLLSAFAWASAQAAPVAASEAAAAQDNPPGFVYEYDFSTWNTSGSPSVIADDDRQTVWFNGGAMLHGVVADGWTIIDWNSTTADTFSVYLNGEWLLQAGTRGTINEFIHVGDMIGFQTPGRAAITYFNVIEGSDNPLPEPGTAVLLGLGLLGTAAMRRKTGR